LPRFFGMTKTFRPVFRPPLAEAPDDVLGEVDALGVVDELDEHAASRTDIAASDATGHAACLSFIS
jgi:hypothetical protein